MESSLKILDASDARKCVGFRKYSFLPRSPSLQCVHHTSAVITLSFPLVCCFFREHLLNASSVPGTVRELAGETSYLPTQSTSRRAQKTQAWVFSYQKPENTCLLRFPCLLVLPWSIHLRNVPLSPHRLLRRGPRDRWGIDCAGLWPGFNLPRLFPHLWSQPREAWCPALRPRCCRFPEGLTRRLVCGGWEAGEGGHGGQRGWQHLQVLVALDLVGGDLVDDAVVGGRLVGAGRGGRGWLGHGPGGRHPLAVLLQLRDDL